MRIAGDLAHRLAAEYVVGTLRGRARARFEAAMRADTRVAAIVRTWEAELTPIAERIAPVEPPARVWRAIEARIGAQQAAAPGLGLAAWRAFGLVASGVAIVLVSAFLWLSQGPRGEPLFVVVLNSAGAEPHALVSMHSPDVLRVRVVKPLPSTEGRDLELWVLPKDGAPRSLGVVRNAVDDTIIRITSSDPRVRGAQALAVTLEPRGGSPTGGPTGPRVLEGPIVPVRRT